MNNIAEVSFIVPFRNEFKIIKRSISTLLNQNLDNIELEILLIDSMSNDVIYTLVKDLISKHSLNIDLSIIKILNRRRLIPGILKLKNLNQK